MTPEDAVRSLRELGRSTDIEDAHIQADKILRDFVVSLGYDAIADAFDNVPKWYA